MERIPALFFTFMILLLFLLITFFAIKLTLGASIVLSILLSFIILNVFYPVSQAGMESPDWSLFVYVIFELLAIIVLSTYIIIATLTSVRLKEIDINSIKY